MTTLPLEEVQANLVEIIDRLAPGESLVITRNNEPVARLLAEEKPMRKPRRAGSARGILVIVSEDDEHLKDFAEYIP